MSLAAIQREQHKYIVENLSELKAEFIFPTKWVIYNDVVHGIGLDTNFNYGFKKFPNIEFGLFITISSIEDLIVPMILVGGDNIRIYDDLNIFSSNMNFFDTLKNKKSLLVKIIFKTFDATVYFFYNCRRKITNIAFGLPLKWNLEIFLCMDKFIRYNCSNPIHNVFYDFNLAYNGELQLQEEFPVLAFDIETVCPNKNRVPRGNHPGDITFSISLIKNGISIFYMYIPNGGVDLDEIHRYFSNDKLQLKLFHSEREMLIAFFNDLHADGKFFILLSYNGNAYDFQFLMYRAISLKIPKIYEHFHMTDDALMSWGSKMFHLDLLIWLSRFKELENYRLNTVAAAYLNESKYDLNAVNLRFIFKRIKEESFTARQLIEFSFEFEDGNISFKDMINYNAVDAQLLIKLYKFMNLNKIFQCMTNNYQLHYEHFLCAKMGKLVSNKLMLQQFTQGNFFTKSQECLVSLIDGIGLISVEMEKAVRNGQTFTGGMNYVSSPSISSDVILFDYKRYYPSMIVASNMSPETMAIVSVELLKCLNSNTDIFADCSKLKFARFMDHKLDDSIFTDINTRKIVNCRGENGHFIDLKDILKLANHEKIVMFNYNKVGQFANFLSTQNIIRDNVNGFLKELIVYLNLLKDKAKWTLSMYETKLINIQIGDIKIDYMTFNKTDLMLMDEEKLQSHISEIQVKYSVINEIYRFMKSENCSYFGLLGSMTEMKNFLLASTLTSLCRSYILETSIRSTLMGGTTLFVDTDSVFITGNNKFIVENLPKTMASIFNGLQLDYKFAKHLLVLRKKTYLMIDDNNVTVSKGINRHGPPLYFWLLDKITRDFAELDADFDLKDFSAYMNGIFVECFEKVKRDKTIALQNKILMKDIDEYETQTAFVKMFKRLPHIESSKVVRFFYAYVVLPSNVFLRHESELEDCPYYHINIFKHLSRVLTVAYQLILIILKRNCKTTSPTLSIKDLENYTLLEFVKVRYNLLSSEEKDEFRNYPTKKRDKFSKIVQEIEEEEKEQTRAATDVDVDVNTVENQPVEEMVAASTSKCLKMKKFKQKNVGNEGDEDAGGVVKRKRICVKNKPPMKKTQNNIKNKRSIAKVDGDNENEIIKKRLIDFSI